MLFGRRRQSLKRILIVEDEPLVAFDNEHFLTDTGYTVVATVDGVCDALGVIWSSELDLVLADVSLSNGGNGMEVAQAAKAKGVPVLFVTGTCPIAARRLAVGCLAKPYSQRDLGAAIAAEGAGLDGRTPKRMPAGLSLYPDGDD